MRCALACVALCGSIACGGDATATSATAASTSATSGHDVDSGSGRVSGSVGDETSPDASSSAGGDDGWVVAAELGVELGMAMSVFGPSPAEVRVVGGQQGGDAGSRGFVLRRSDGAWIEETLPAGTPMLDWIGAAGSDLWAVGLEGAALRREGDEWVAHATGTDVTLWGVWGADAGEVWAVGGDGVSEPPTLLRFDGAVWSEAVLPELPRASHGLFKVWGSDREHVFVVGDGGAVMRRDRGAWVADRVGSVAPLISVWGRGPDEAVAVGGRANARVLRWDGAAWAGTTLEAAGCNGVWVDTDGTAIVVCRMGGIHELAPGSIDLVAVDSPTLHLLHAVHGFTEGPRFAVGGSFEGPPPWVGVILEHAR